MIEIGGKWKKVKYGDKRLEKTREGIVEDERENYLETGGVGKNWERKKRKKRGDGKSRGRISNGRIDVGARKEKKD